MAASIEWDIAYTLATPGGTIPMNTSDVFGTLEDGGIYILETTACSMGAPVRATIDDVPQSDGSILHPVLLGGYRCVIAANLWQTRELPACGELLVAMNDFFVRCINSLRPEGGGRLGWNPSGSSFPERMLDDLWMVGDFEYAYDGVSWRISASLASSFPYAIDAAETTTSIASGGTAVLNNYGSSAFKPVIKVYGPSSGFTIENADSLDDEGNPRKLVYDSSLPGAHTIAAAHYIEFDFFRETAYLDGSSVSRKSGIDITISDFFPLEIGTNSISIVGASCDILWNPAYA